MRRLVRPKAECSASTFHDSGRIQPTKHARLIVFSRRESRAHSVILVRQRSLAYWAAPLIVGRTGELCLRCTFDAEDVPEQ